MAELISQLQAAGIDGSTLVLAVFAFRIDAKIAELTASIGQLSGRISQIEGKSDL